MPGKDLCDMSGAKGRTPEQFTVFNVMLPRKYNPEQQGNLFERRAKVGGGWGSVGGQENSPASPALILLRSGGGSPVAWVGLGPWVECSGVVGGMVPGQKLLGGHHSPVTMIAPCAAGQHFMALLFKLSKGLHHHAAAGHSGAAAQPRDGH